MITTVDGMEKEETHTVSLIECIRKLMYSIKINFNQKRGRKMEAVKKQSGKEMLREQVQHIVETIETGEYEPIDEDMGCCGFDYLSDALDFEWILNSDRTLKGARILVAFGGPNIWINTVTEQVEGYWWSDTVILDYNRDALDLDDAIETIYNC